MNGHHKWSREILLRTSFVSFNSLASHLNAYWPAVCSCGQSHITCSDLEVEEVGMRFFGPECGWIDFLEMSKHTVWLLHPASRNSVPAAWKIRVARPHNANRGLLKQLCTVYLKPVESELKMLVCFWCYILKVLCRRMFSCVWECEMARCKGIIFCLRKLPSLNNVLGLSGAKFTSWTESWNTCLTTLELLHIKACQLTAVFNFTTCHRSSWSKNQFACVPFLNCPTGILLD